jgi:hypothetical protein
MAASRYAAVYCSWTGWPPVSGRCPAGLLSSRLLTLMSRGVALSWRASRRAPRRGVAQEGFALLETALPVLAEQRFWRRRRRRGCRSDRGRSAQAVGDHRSPGCPGGVARDGVVPDHDVGVPGVVEGGRAVAQADLGRGRCWRGGSSAGAAAAGRWGTGPGRAGEAVRAGSGVRRRQRAQDRRPVVISTRMRW